MENKTTDVLSWGVTLLSIMSVEVTGFERLKEEYESYSEFKEVFMTLRDENNHIVDGYHLQKGYVIQDNKLVSWRHLCMNFWYERFMLEVFQNTLEEIKSLKMWNINCFSLVWKNI